MPRENSERPRVLVVDVDGTLIRTDLLFEQALVYLKRNPLGFFTLLAQLLFGIAQLKEFLAREVHLDVSLLPYRAEILDRIIEHRRSGGTIILASASHQSYVQKIAEHLGCVDVAVGTDAGVNLKGKQKLEKIRAIVKDSPFMYAGDSVEDLPVWAHAEEVIVVEPNLLVASKLRKSGKNVTVFKNSRSRLMLLAKAFRVHQWPKNFLVFLPALAAHRIFEPKIFGVGAAAFIAFAFASSAIYLLNDLLDLESDRRHSVKRCRPFAAGELSVKSGLLIFPVLLASSAVVTLRLPQNFAIALTSYFCANLAYSFGLKKVMMVDVILLASMYTMRVIAGSGATDVAVSSWLLAFSIFFFFGLAMVKRFAEILRLDPRQDRQVFGRGYISADKEVVLGLGICGSMLSCVVMGLYIDSMPAGILYPHPHFLWLLLPLLLYWNARVWLLANRGLVSEDPVHFAFRDKVTWIVGAGIVLIMLFSKGIG